MKRTVLKRALCLAVLGLSLTFSAQAAVRLLGRADVPSNLNDLSGLSDTLEDGTPHNRLGAFGSGIAYAGGSRFLAVPDRGPNASSYNPSVDNTTAFQARFQEFEITLSDGAPLINLVRTRTLNDANGAFTGLSSGFDAANSPLSRRFDPEEIRVANDGASVFISDEYGPFLYQFDRQSGLRTRVFSLPAKFKIATPAPTSAAEISGNTSGRVANRGMEGLAITPDGKTLLGVMQNPLIQDGGREGLLVRLLKIDIQSGQTQEYIYTLSNKANGLNGAVAINQNEFLIIERDGRAGTQAVFKRIFKIDLSGASDVSAIASLPLVDPPSGTAPVSKSNFIDLLDPAFALSGASFPEKIEGIAFGPKLSNANLSVLITADNDFTSAPNSIFAFSVDASDLNFVPQQLGSNVTQVPLGGNLLLVLLSLGLIGLAAYERRATLEGDRSLL
jgi:hypothetical protein